LVVALIVDVLVVVLVLILVVVVVPLVVDGLIPETITKVLGVLVLAAIAVVVVLLIAWAAIVVVVVELLIVRTGVVVVIVSVVIIELILPRAIIVALEGVRFIERVFRGTQTVVLVIAEIHRELLIAVRLLHCVPFHVHIRHAEIVIVPW